MKFSRVGLIVSFFYLISAIALFLWSLVSATEEAAWAMVFPILPFLLAFSQLEYHMNGLVYIILVGMTALIAYFLVSFTERLIKTCR